MPKCIDLFKCSQELNNHISSNHIDSDKNVEIYLCSQQLNNHISIDHIDTEFFVILLCSTCRDLFKE